MDCGGSYVTLDCVDSLRDVWVLIDTKLVFIASEKPSPTATREILLSLRFGFG